MGQAKQRQRRLNILIAQSEQIYTRLIEQLGGSEGFDASRVPDALRNAVVVAAWAIVQNTNEIAELLQEAVMDGAPQPLSDRAVEFFRNTLRPQRDAFLSLVLDLLDLREIDLDLEDLEVAEREAAKHQPVWGILRSGVDFWELNDSGQVDEQDVKDAERLVDADLFRPDEWLSNVEELEPVLGESADSRVSGHVRNRLREIYRSYIFGNHLAVIALARATLEYTLIDRASRLGVDPSAQDPKHPNRKKRLGALVEEAAEHVPRLKCPMETVLEEGNQALHPQKRDKLRLHPAAVRDRALQSLRAIHRIVEELYLRT